MSIPVHGEEILRFSIRELGQDYYDAAAPVVELQIRRAGVRLAKVLTAALNPNAPDLETMSLHLSAIALHLGPAPYLSDQVKTPGHASYRSARSVCSMPSTKDVRNVDDAAESRVYENYGVAKCQGYCNGKEGCEIDHLMNLELGGANTEANFWPQPYGGEWNAHDKDSLENRLKRFVCIDKTISLENAQKEIAANWIAAYKKYVGERMQFNCVQHCH